MYVSFARMEKLYNNVIIHANHDHGLLLVFITNNSPLIIDYWLLIIFKKTKLHEYIITSTLNLLIYFFFLCKWMSVTFK